MNQQYEDRNSKEKSVSIKERFQNNKKKIILGVLLVASFLFPPVRALIPVVEFSFPPDQVEQVNEQK